MKSKRQVIVLKYAITKGLSVMDLLDELIGNLHSRCHEFISFSFQKINK